MEASANEFEDKELAAALERSKADVAAAAAHTGLPAAGHSAAQPTPDAKLTVLPGDKFTEENVQALIKYGFPREKVRFSKAYWFNRMLSSISFRLLRLKAILSNLFNGCLKPIKFEHCLETIWQSF